MFRGPRLFTIDGTSERHATWLELFFDLVFVVAVAELAHLLHDDLSLQGICDLCSPLCSRLVTVERF